MDVYNASAYPWDKEAKPVSWLRACCSGCMVLCSTAHHLRLASPPTQKHAAADRAWTSLDERGRRPSLRSPQPAATHGRIWPTPCRLTLMPAGHQRGAGAAARGG